MKFNPSFWSTPRSRRTLIRLRGSQEMVKTKTTATRSLQIVTILKTVKIVRIVVIIVKL